MALPLMAEYEPPDVAAWPNSPHTTKRLTAGISCLECHGGNRGYNTYVEPAYPPVYNSYVSPRYVVPQYEVRRYDNRFDNRFSNQFSNQYWGHERREFDRWHDRDHDRDDRFRDRNDYRGNSSGFRNR